MKMKVFLKKVHLLGLIDQTYKTVEDRMTDHKDQKKWKQVKLSVQSGTKVLHQHFFGQICFIFWL